ncbi:MAG TPA: hypothetical protein P5293_09185, partial [Bacteroidales bacterium]|nr:hypothetical protein [Bacteroidales bacterium]
MPDKELEVSCPGCSAIFNVPAELAGEIAECSECGAVFEIPKPEESPQEPGTETGAIKGKITEESETATNTVKLSRTSIGMIPSLKDSFTFGDPVKSTTPPPPRPGSGPTFQQPTQVQKPASTPTQSGFPIPPARQQPIQQTTPPVESPQFKTQMRHPSPPPQQPHTPPVSSPPPPPPSSASSAQKMTFKKPTVPSQTQAPHQSTPPLQQNIQLPPWTRIQLRPDEQLYGFREITGNPVGTAFGASFPILISLIAVFMAKSDAVISYIIVVAIWLVTFVTIALISAKS